VQSSWEDGPLGGSSARREKPLGRRSPRGSQSPGWPEQSARRHGRSQGARPWRGASRDRAVSSQGCEERQRPRARSCCDLASRGAGVPPTARKAGHLQQSRPDSRGPGSEQLLRRAPPDGRGDLGSPKARGRPERRDGCSADRQPQEGNGARDGVRLCGWKSTLKGGTPRAGPAWNKAGRCGAEESLESVRNAEEARTRGLVSLGMSGCPAPGRRRRGRNRKGGSRRTGRPVPRRRRCDQALERGERLGEDRPGESHLSGGPAGRRPQRSAARRRPERERRNHTVASAAGSKTLEARPTSGELGGSW
jgi:hypothetical protein